MYKKILVPIDLSDQKLANRILDVASDMIKGNGVELHALCVVPTFNMSIVGSYFPKNFEKSALEDAKNALKEILNSRKEKTIKGHVAHGLIYDEIMKAADSLKCDLIVMASHRPELKDYLLGPNSARVVRHAKQSVFVVRD